MSKNKSTRWSIVEGEENPILLFDEQEISFEELFFVGTEITRETLKSLRLISVVQGIALWLLVIPGVLLGVLSWVG